MTIEEMIRGSSENLDKFPAGMRVLAVDDDSVCLKTLGAMLLKCKYNVTTSNHAKDALKILRENKDGFDLVISDVHMPDMDGFKLLEHIGLEMDIPVIMLSINNDPNLVMKGVTHGACDYLVKPVRLEELQNIWQHVIRRKKFQNKATDEVKDHQSNGEVYESPVTDNAADQKRRLNRKRREEEGESEDDEDLATQKKARVVWSIDLHKKFVAAVNQLGIEKAVPKKILDLMNIEGLTRENVASHLQKYRLYLKKISPLAIQQANMRTAMGYDDYRFMRPYPSNWLGDFNSLSGAGRLGSTSLSPYSTPGMLGRLNSTASAPVNIRDVASSSMMQSTHAQTLSNSAATLALGKMYPALSSSSQNPFVFQGNSSSLEANNFLKGFDSFNPSSSNINTAANKMMLNVSAHNMASFNSEPFNQNVTGFSTVPDQFQLPIETNNPNGTYNFPLENAVDKSPSEERARSSENFPMELPRWQGGYVPSSNYDNLDDLMNTMLKRDGTSLNTDFGFDDCSFGEVL